ncbi:MAG TPA: SIS domain-containing protein [Nitrososphaerales archaeon]|nr:SIS domain-containing protein [Nitrososphaerales archaeon]
MTAGDAFTQALIRKVDSHRVSEAYADWPRLARKGYEADVEIPERKYKRVVVLGMGGSAAGGDILAGWMRSTRRGEMAVCKGYLPFEDLNDSLAIACSASGDTRETVWMMKTAMSRGATMVCISSGGKLKEVAQEEGVPYIDMPTVLKPRYMLPFIVFSELAVTRFALRLDCEEEARSALSEMEKTSAAISPKTPPAENPSKRLASRLLDKTPSIYAATVTRGAAVRFKNALNENAKKHAVVDVIPELFHNEVETWEYTSDFIPFFLRHSGEGRWDKRGADAMTALLEETGRGPLSVSGTGDTPLAELISLVYELELVSYYVAIGLGRDPFPTKLLDALKKSN